MEYNTTMPIWLQVVTRIKGDIVTGKRQPGEKMPGGREMAVQYSINPNTAARVYQELEKEGLCATRRGLGTFVTEDAERIAALRDEMAREAIRQFWERMETLGLSHDDAIRMLEKEEETNHA